MATGVSNTNKQHRLLQLIECPICLNEMNDPRLLSCRHALCHQCLKDYTEKGDYVDELSCPVCRQITLLYQGGVDNLPEFFFMNSLKEVVLENDEVCAGDSPSGPVCSTESCTKSAVKYCTLCQFMCQQCYDDHQSIGITKTHKVIPSSEAATFTKSTKPPYPPCKRHKHQLMDLYCRTCHLPVCNTCSNSNHRSHDCCELEEQAEMCKTKLEHTREDTDELIGIVKQAMDKTKQQVEQAEADIDDACDNVKSTFKLLHEKLDEEEKTILSKMREARKLVMKTGDVTADSQMMTLASLEILNSCQDKLAAKGNDYDYVTVTDSLQRDVEIHLCGELPGFEWKSEIVQKGKIGDINYSGRVEIKQSENIKELYFKAKNLEDDVKEEEEVKEEMEVKKVCKIAQQKQTSHIIGMVIYKENVYTVHRTGLTVYCYTRNGSFISKYEHVGGAKTHIEGMCLIMNGNTPMLVVSACSKKCLVWIEINDVTMDHHHTQQLDYNPFQSYNDGDQLLVCGDYNNKIHRYSSDGQSLEVINLPGDVRPWGMTLYGDQYVISDNWNKQIVLINKAGQVKIRYKGEIHGVKIGHTCEVISGSIGTILITNHENHQVLMLNLEEDEVKQVLQNQHVRFPVNLYLSSDHQLYVSGLDQNDKRHVFVFDYKPINKGRSLKVKITKLDFTVKMGQIN